MIKIFSFSILIFSAFFSFGQTSETDEVSTCNFQLEYEDDLKDKIYVLTAYQVNGINRFHQWKRIRKKLNLFSGQKLMINEDFFYKKFSLICSDKRLKITTLKIYIDPASELGDEVRLVITFEKI